MDLAFKKLPKSAIDHLFRCRIGSVKPFALMVAPVYIYMPLNEKFVAIKGPLDFFTEEELRKWSSYGEFYVSDFIETVKPFQETARAIGALIQWEPRSGALGPTPYELSDAVLRALGPLWSKGAAIEPYFASVCGHELCGRMPKELLLEARERDLESFDRALLISGWTVFLALHLGYLNLSFLRELRIRVFTGTRVGNPEVEELVAAAKEAALDPWERVKLGDFERQDRRAARKLAARLQRVSGELIDRSAPARTIYGEEGFLLHG